MDGWMDGWIHGLTMNGQVSRWLDGHAAVPTITNGHLIQVVYMVPGIITPANSLLGA